MHPNSNDVMFNTSFMSFVHPTWQKDRADSSFQKKLHLFDKKVYFFYERRRKSGYLQTVDTVVWIIFDLQRELSKQRIGFSHIVFSLTNFRPITGRHTPFYLLFINIVFPDNTAGEPAQLLTQWYVSSVQMPTLPPSGCIHSKSDAATKQARLYGNFPAGGSHIFNIIGH